MRKPLIFVALFLLPILALAEKAPTAANTPAPKIYEIEVMVFQNIQNELEGNELWLNERIDPVLVDIDKAVEIRNVPLEETELTKAREVLDEDANYRLLTHKQWVQNADSQSDARLIRLTTGDGELDGTFRFFVSRFLHVQLNLIFQEKASNSFFQAGDRDDSQLVAYQLRERRRIRSDEVQYFDHPKFGVLVLVKQVKVSTN